MRRLGIGAWILPSLLIVPACAHAPNASPDPAVRTAVLKPVVDHALAFNGAQIPIIDPTPVGRYSCKCPSDGTYLRTELPSLDSSTLASYCTATPPRALTRRELRDLWNPSPLISRLGWKSTPLRFSPIGVGESGSQALVCVAEIQCEAFYLLQREGSGWKVVDMALGIQN